MWSVEPYINQEVHEDDHLIPMGFGVLDIHIGSLPNSIWTNTKAHTYKNTSQFFLWNAHDFINNLAGELEIVTTTSMKKRKVYLKRVNKAGGKY